MSLPKEPRQKMINIMYLFLTAMLALNISAEILNAFKTVNRSLQNTNKTVNNSTQTILESLRKKTAVGDPNQERAVYWLPRAEKVVAISKELYDYIEGIKKQILSLAGEKTGNSEGKYDEGNQSYVTKLMVDDGKAKELFAKLSKYKTDILAVDPQIDSAFKAQGIDIDLSNPAGQDGKIKPWEIAYFHMVPTVAGLTILSKFQNDIRTAENKVVAYCHQRVGEVIVVFDTYTAIVGQNTNYAMPGQEVEVTAGIGAFSKQALPTISIGGNTVPLGEEGFASYKFQASGGGEKSVHVTINYTDQASGEKKTVERDIKYTVGTPSGASVALDKMNVLYIGVDNPATIASSVGDDKTQVSISGGGGTVQKNGAGKYTFRVSTPGDCQINVIADGKTSSYGFRVRNIPEAQAYVGGKPSGETFTESAFKAQAGVGAGIKNFPFELEYNVQSFTFTCDTDDDIAIVKGQGAAFAGNVRTAIQQHVKAGRLVTIDDIIIKGPDGRTMKAPSLVYYIR